MTPRDHPPTWVVSAGDPAGSSPELIPVLLEQIKPGERLFITGPRSVVQRLDLDVKTVTTAPRTPGTYWWKSRDVARDTVLSGNPGAESGAAAYDALRQALQLVDSVDADGLLTLPLSKSAVREAGHAGFTGHTELLESHWESRGVMSFFGREFNVALLTRHTPLADVSSELNVRQVKKKVQIIDNFYREYEQKRPSLALLGLNPHAGESGHIGTEETEVLRPAVEALSDQGIQISGPHPADSFLPVKGGEVDLIFACYHDQGLGPFKLNQFFTGIQVTPGLPRLRVSPDHGVAAELAGQEGVDPRSTLNCLKNLRNWSGSSDDS